MQINDAEKKMLEVAAQSGGHRVTLDALAKACGKQPDFVYKKLQEPHFRQLFTEALRGALMVEVPEIVSSFLTEAKKGSFQHGKLLLEIAGVYTQDTNVNINALVASKEAPLLTKEEKDDFIKATLANYIDGKTLEKEEGDEQ